MSTGSFHRGAARAGARGAAALLLLALGAGLATAGDLEFSAAVDRTTVGVGEQLELTLTVRGEDMLSAPSPTLPPLPDFTLLGSSSSQSTSISIMNGQMKKQATVNFVYALAPRRLGTATIPACRLVYQGKTYESQPIEITVVKAPQGQAAPSPSQLAAPPSRASVPLEGNLFLSVVPSRRTVYLGEPITLEVALCTRYQLANAGWAAMPSFDGFWAENLYDADRFDFQRRVIDGKPYDVSVLKRVELFPTSPGTATIKPMAFNVAVSQAPRDFFDMFGSTQTVRLESKPIAITVLPLPDNGRPSEFTGGVGRFTMTASLDRAATTNSEPVSLTIQLSGSGNIRMIDKPKLAPVDGLRILEPEVKDDAHASPDGVRGTKTFRFPIIPQGDGKYVVPPVAVAYFDPQDKAYHTLKAGPFEFAASGSAASAPLVEATGLKVLGTDIAYIKPDASALPVTPLAPPWWPSFLYLLSLGMVGSALWYRGHSERLLSDRGYARKTRSSGLVRQRLRQAERLLRKNDDKGFYAALTQAVMGYIGDRFNIETHAMTKDQLRSALEQNRVAPEVSAAVLEIVDECELARFSPALLERRDPKRLFERSREALGKI
ncbi:MAG TPA: BatD family protein [Candidatus Eisenbacteria bacterium]